MPYPPSPPLLNEEGEVFELEEPVFNDVLWTIAFVAIVFAAGKVVARLGMPPLVGEIISGVIFGPPLWNKVPQPTALMTPTNLPGCEPSKTPPPSSFLDGVAEFLPRPLLTRCTAN